MGKFFFVVPQKAVIKKGDKYLILKRSPNAQTYPNHWDFPGGRLEHGENPGKGLEREVFEETGLKTKACRPVFSYSEMLIGHYDYFVVWKSELLSGAVKLSDEHTDFKWASGAEILKLEIENYLREFLLKDGID